MPQMFGEAPIMAFSCLLVVLSVVYPVAAFQAAEEAGLDIGKEAGALTHGLSEIQLADSQLQVPNIRSRKQGGHPHGGVTSSDSQTLAVGSCSGTDISIQQNQGSTSGSGISEFKAEILNNCACPVSNIHVNCGEFASAEPLNPNEFKRVAVNDCLVNGGKPLPPATLVAFTYANSFMYPLGLKSATFCR